MTEPDWMGLDRERTRSEELNATFDVFRFTKRRYILYCVKKYGDSHLNDVAREVQREIDWDVDFRHLILKLEGQHLPNMDRMGVINYDKEDKMIEYNGGQMIDEILAMTSEYEDFEL